MHLRFRWADLCRAGKGVPCQDWGADFPESIPNPTPEICGRRAPALEGCTDGSQTMNAVVMSMPSEDRKPFWLTDLSDLSSRTALAWEAAEDDDDDYDEDWEDDDEDYDDDDDDDDGDWDDDDEDDDWRALAFVRRRRAFIRDVEVAG